MKKLLHMSLIAVFSAIAVGCISGGTAKVGTTELYIRRGTNEFRLKNPKDTSIEEFTLGLDGTVRLIGYRAIVNEHLVQGAKFEAAVLHDERKTAMDFFDRGVQAGASRYGVNMAPANVPSVTVPATVVLTNAPGK
jgi:hypothetical protein